MNTFLYVLGYILIAIIVGLITKYVFKEDNFLACIVWPVFLAIPILCMIFFPVSTIKSVVNFLRSPLQTLKKMKRKSESIIEAGKAISTPCVIERVKNRFEILDL